jgi:S1-C subfamily serine protease
MSKMFKNGMFAALLIVTIVMTACGSSAVSPTQQAATVDTDAISQVVLAEVESKLAQAPSEPAATVDPSEIAAQVLTEVESTLAQRSAATAAATDPVTADQVVNSLQSALTRVYQQANPAVVYIIVPSVGSGSGFVYNADGYIVTNNHVVEQGQNYEVVFANGERRSADLVGADAGGDLAVIKVDGLPDGVEPLPLAAPDSLQVGQLVVAIGNPFGEQGSMSLGIVSGLNRSLRAEPNSLGSSYSLPEVIQTDAPINPGNSGGPLLNLDGEVVGVNSAIATTTGTNSGVGFSIPVAAVRQIVPSLISDGEYHYPYLGIGVDDEVSLSDQEEYGLSQTQGTYVLEVTPGSPADEAGLVAANPNTHRGGDLIVAIDDKPVNNFSEMNSYLVFHTTVGQRIELTVLRNGQRVVVPLTLGERP